MSRGGNRAGSGRPPKPRKAGAANLPLEEEYESDPTLLKMYKTKLPQRGWAGRKTPNERAYLAHRSQGSSISPIVEPMRQPASTAEMSIGGLMSPTDATAAAKE